MVDDQKINVAIVDDQSLFREGIVSILKTVPQFNLVLEAASGAELEALFSSASVLPDVLLMDMKLEDSTGIELHDIVQKRYPGIKVLVLSMYAQERLVFRMIEAGAAGYLAKNCSKEELITAIATVYKNGFYFNDHSLSAMKNATANSSRAAININNIPIELSSREKEILLLVCKEMTNAEIAEQLFISIRTVDGHRNNLLGKTGCKNTAGLVVFAIKHNIFQIVL